MCKRKPATAPSIAIVPAMTVPKFDGNTNARALTMIDGSVAAATPTVNHMNVPNAAHDKASAAVRAVYTATLRVTYFAKNSARPAINAPMNPAKIGISPLPMQHQQDASTRRPPDPTTGTTPQPP